MPDAALPDGRGVGRHVVLVGAMGAGKSTIGVLLAAALERPFLDNDAELLRATGCTAAQLVARDGIDALHDAEAEVILGALRASGTAVIAAAASTVVVPAVRDALERDAVVVWLRAAPAVLVARLPRSAGRPFADEEPVRLVTRQARDRDPLFARVADLSVESDAGTPDEVVARILETLPSQARANG